MIRCDADRGLFCGFDTSNYTTSAAAVSSHGEPAANLKVPLPVAKGGRGLRQSEALFEHIRNLPGLARSLSEIISESGALPLAVAASSAPRSAEGSYMPCFRAGVAAAESFAAGAGIPCYTFSHQQGHVAAAYVMSGAEKAVGRERFISFHVSGGTTDILLVDPVPGDPVIERAGGTEDLNAGQAIDRAGVAMGMGFPCGPAMDEAARGYLASGGTLRTPPAGVSVRGLSCNLSGLENLASAMKDGGADRGEVSLFIFDFLGRTLMRLALNARERFGDLPVVFAGGVMSNSVIKGMLSKLPGVYFADPVYSADNAVGIALLCREKYYAENS
ncbi:MAG: peptidase M22 [Clostridia bacterium]|nr:peptidase M22 [Clostridia bacterium]MBP5173821.1 peptidase M22 [Clostridia bacterium]